MQHFDTEKIVDRNDISGFFKIKGVKHVLLILLVNILKSSHEFPFGLAISNFIFVIRTSSKDLNFPKIHMIRY